MKKIIIDAKSEPIKTALTENGELTELIASYRKKTLNIGDIYTGKIKRILKSGFAFIDLGEDKNTFLCLKDKKENRLWQGEKLTVKEGNDITVQVTREEQNEKGAAVTTALSLSGNFTVVSLGEGQVRISRKISDTAKREELAALFYKPKFAGFDIIVRTKAETVSPDEVLAEAAALADKLNEICETAEYRKAPARIYEGDSEALSAIKAFSAEDDTQIITNDTEAYYEFIDPYRLFTPTLYEGEIPIFREHFIESKIEKALNPKVWLKSGGFIIIEATEAMVVIDVNTGKNNTKAHEEAVFKTNKEAAEEISKQLRLRNLSGMIVIDFINMKDPENNKKIVELLKSLAKYDRISSTVIGMTDLGLVLMTRKKVGLPLKHHLTKPCPTCRGKGYTLK